MNHVPILTAADLGAEYYGGVGADAIYARLSRAPNTLPPSFKIGRTRLWRRESVTSGFFGRQLAKRTTGANEVTGMSSKRWLCSAMAQRPAVLSSALV